MKKKLSSTHLLLAASVAANLALVVRTLTHHGLVIAAAESPREAPKPPTPPPSAPDLSSRPTFSWDQVESRDFPTYVANLRSIGCPEDTIRDIVAGEMKEIYDEKRRQVTGRHTPAASNQTASVSRMSRSEQQQVDEIYREEQAATTRILSQTPASSDGGAAVAPTEQPVMPLVLRPLNFQSIPSGEPGAPPLAVVSAAPNAGAAGGSGIALNEPQQAAIAQLQQTFVQSVGGPNQDPQDPAYLAKWQAVQPGVDDLLRTQLGWQEFNLMQIAAEHAAETGQTAQGTNP